MITLSNGKKRYTYSDFENYKLKSDQTYRVQNLKKMAKGVPFQFTVWSDEQLDRLFEDEVIDDVNFTICLGKSAEKGYSWNRGYAQERDMTISELKGIGEL